MLRRHFLDDYAVKYAAEKYWWLSMSFDEPKYFLDELSPDADDADYFDVSMMM